MSIISKKELKIDSDDQEIIQSSDYRKRRNNKMKNQVNKTVSQTDPIYKKKNDLSRKNYYRPSRMSDSFMPSAPDLDEIPQKKVSYETYEIKIPTRIFDIEAETYFENERALDEPFLFQTVETQETNENRTNVTAGLDQQELIDYMRKNQKINRMMVSIIVGIIVIGAVIAVVLLVLNLRRAGQTSPLGGV